MLFLSSLSLDLFFSPLSVIRTSPARHSSLHRVGERVFSLLPPLELTGHAGPGQVTFMGKAHIFPYQIEAYKQNRYAVDPLFSAISASRWEELEDELGWHLLGEAQLLPPGHEGGSWLWLVCLVLVCGCDKGCRHARD
eukprot:518633-Rhodomonas_salina.2